MKRKNQKSTMLTTTPIRGWSHCPAHPCELPLFMTAEEQFPAWPQAREVLEECLPNRSTLQPSIDPGRVYVAAEWCAAATEVCPEAEQLVLSAALQRYYLACARIVPTLGVMPLVHALDLSDPNSWSYINATLYLGELRRVSWGMPYLLDIARHELGLKEYKPPPITTILLGSA